MFAWSDKLTVLTDTFPDTIEDLMEECKDSPLVITEYSHTWPKQPTLLFDKSFYLPDRDGQIRPGVY